MREKHPLARVGSMQFSFGRLPEKVRDAPRRLVVVGGVGEANVTVVEDRVVGTVSLLELVERLGDEEGLEAIAGDERQGSLEEFEPAEARKLVEEKEEPVLVGCL